MEHELVLTPWKKHGHDRTYISTATGERLGYRDNATGELRLLDERWHGAVQAALGTPQRSEPGPPTVAQPVGEDPGRAGGSAKAEYEKRVARREQRIREAHPRLGGLILALSDDPQSTRAWASGAVGEARVGAKLDGLAGEGVLVLHDRRIPRTRANIDHIAVGPSGVFVIDAKRYRGAAVEVRRSGGHFAPVSERLFVGGRDKTGLVAGMAPQVAAVYEALEGLTAAGDTPVQPVLTFVDADLPLVGSLEIAGVPVLGLRRTAKLVRRAGTLSDEQRQRLHAHLANALPAYTR